MIRSFLSSSFGLALFALVFCTAANAQSFPASSPAQAVRVLVRPFYDPRYSLATCAKQPARLHPGSICPVTDRLRRRLNRPRQVGDEIWLCRCQNPPRTVRIIRVSVTGSVAHVSARWDFGPQSYVSTFVLRHPARGKGWLVDDVYCSGRPGTSLYASGRQVACR